jgi:glutamyl-tRNA synthetase
MSVRVRFAPSPTGLLHVGALRTVLFDHLFAHKHGGQTILRIEDTDRTRYNPESEAEFVQTLKWVGIEFNEGPHIDGPNGPYRQSERKEAGIYAEWTSLLLAKGGAYKAFETPQELDEMREFQQNNKQATGYFGGAWRDATPEAVAEAEAKGLPFVVRQRIPRGQKVVMEDAIRGRIEVQSDLLPDPVLIKADGMPTYHFAAIVDDHLMGITHVFRGEEWLPSFPIHWLLLEAFGWEKPTFIHCPVIVGADGKKLSKRHGATRVLDYAAQGYLPDALKNFIALIGWSPGNDQEVFAEDELAQAFGIEGLQPSPGRFDLEKLKWLNGYRIRAMSAEELYDALMAYVADPYTREYWTAYVEESPMPNRPPVIGAEILRKLDLIPAADREYAIAAIREEQQRVQILSEFGDALEFFLVAEPPMDSKATAKWLEVPHVHDLLSFVLGKLEETPNSHEGYESLLKGWASENGFEKLGPVVHPVRVTLTGKTQGPGLYELMTVLGKDRMRARLEKALAKG